VFLEDEVPVTVLLLSLRLEGVARQTKCSAWQHTTCTLAHACLHKTLVTPYSQ